jgi:hypothetical protein
MFGERKGHRGYAKFAKVFEALCFGEGYIMIHREGAKFAKVIEVLCFGEEGIDDSQ